MPKDEQRFVAPCAVCGRVAPGDYIKYSFLGFELAYLVCGDCYVHIEIAGLLRLKVEVQSLREQLGKKGKDENPG